MDQKVISFSRQHCQKEVPVLAAGDLVRVVQRVKEGNKERLQTLQGTVIKLNSGHGINKTFTVRWMASGVGVEKVIPFYAPSIEVIELKRSHKVRQAKIYFLRERSGKSARLREVARSVVMQKPLVENAPEPKAETAAPVEA